MRILDKISEIKSNREKERAKDIQDKFILAFGDIIKSGDSYDADEFGHYLKSFLSITESVWRFRNDVSYKYSLEQYVKNVNALVDIGTGTGNPNAKIKVLIILEAVYDRIAHCIYEDKILESAHPIRSSRRGFDLFNTGDFFGLIRDIEIKTVEKIINIPTLLYNVNLADMALYYDKAAASTALSSAVTKKNGGEKSIEYQKVENPLNHWVTTATVIDIQALLGQYISEQKHKGNMPTISYWIKEFSGWYYASLDKAVADGLKEYWVTAIANAGAMYTCGLITEGCFDIVEEGLYNRCLTTVSLSSPIDRRVVAVVHAFLYYMLYCEDEKYVGADLRNEAFQFWSKVAGKYKYYIGHYDQEISSYLIDNLNDEWHFVNKTEGREKEITGDTTDAKIADKEEHIPDYKSQWIYYLLRRFDFRMRNRNGVGILILSDSVEDFCLFTILYLKRYGFNGLPLAWMTDEKHSVSKFLKYIDRENMKSVKKRVHEFVEFMLVDTARVAADGDKEHNLLFKTIYEYIRVGISDLYKEEKIKEARKKEAEYLKNKEKIDEMAVGWRDTVLKDIITTFGEDIDTFGSNTNCIKYVQVHLLQYSIHTDMLDEAIDDNICHRIVSSLIDNYIRYLASNELIDKKDRGSFRDDQDYIHYLNNNNIEIMVGSEYLLKNHDYLMSEKFQKATANFKWLTSSGCFFGMGLKKESVRFYLQDLDVTVKNSDISSEYVGIKGPEYDPDGYFYEPVKGVPLEFQREELEDFLGKSRKIVDVTARIGVTTYGENPIGFYFENERIPIRS